MIEELKKHLKETPIEELKKEWKEVEEWGNVGPSVKEYIKIMKTKSIEVCDAIIISVSCKENDSTDIKCGGPAVLGYDFGVSPDEDINEWKKKVKGFVSKYNRPFMGISHYKHKDFPVEHLWSLERIEECIKENGVY